MNDPASIPPPRASDGGHEAPEVQSAPAESPRESRPAGPAPVDLAGTPGADDAGDADDEYEPV